MVASGTGHRCRRGDRLPATNTEYWQAKIQRNRDRDRRMGRSLAEAGWRLFTLWECDLDAATKQLLASLDAERSGVSALASQLSSSPVQARHSGARNAPN